MTTLFEKRDHQRDFERMAEQVRRLRLAARCLEMPAVFVSDHPLVAELFDARGRHVDTWDWR